MRNNSELTTIGFDADDTLWQNEQFFRLTEERFAACSPTMASAEHISAATAGGRAAQPSAVYGFGIKGFTLSMIETAIEVTDGRVPASVIARDPRGRPRDAEPSGRDAAACARDAGERSPAHTASC